MIDKVKVLFCRHNPSYFMFCLESHAGTFAARTVCPLFMGPVCIFVVHTHACMPHDKIYY